MKKNKLFITMLASAMVLAACSKGPDDELTEEQVREYEIQREVNKLAGLKDGESEKAELYKNTISKISYYGEEVANKEIKVGDEIISYNDMIYGQDSKMQTYAQEIILLEGMKKSLKEKEIREMEKLLEKQYFKNEKVGKEMLNGFAIKAAYYKKNNVIEEEMIVEMYKKYYQEKVFKGLIDMPLYEDNEDYYEALYVVSNSQNQGVDIQKFKGDVEFGEFYKWLSNGIFGENVDSELKLEREESDVVFEINNRKVTVGELAKYGYKNEYLSLFEEASNTEVYKKYITDKGYDFDEVRKSWAQIGYNVLSDKEIAEIIGFAAALEEDGFFKENNFDEYYKEVKERVKREEEVMKDENIKMFYKFEMIMELGTQEDIEAAEKLMWSKNELEFDKSMMKLLKEYNENVRDSY